ncbi:tail assembly chaperone [Dubosiella newyorkensis]|uniref:tail assembly chaperone n=1 Tax=Dubosiella newyorkensis TaxID=1862672 RepID=UPI00257376FD|nr:tail assembly chaperone [Dubosiella newyorkensis]
MEITIKDKVHQLRATFGFLAEIDREMLGEASKKDNPTIGAGTGLAQAVIQWQEVGDIYALRDIVYSLCNHEAKERPTKKDIESYIESCENLDAFSDEVINFLYKANVCKKALKKMADPMGAAVKEEMDKLKQGELKA